MINPIRAFRLAMLSLPSTGRDESGDGVGLACLVIPYTRDLLPPPSPSLSSSPSISHLSFSLRLPFVPFQDLFLRLRGRWPGIRPATLENTGYLSGRRSIYVAAHVPV